MHRYSDLIMFATKTVILSVALIVMSNLNIAAFAQQTASVGLSGEVNETPKEPAHKPNEKSSDHGFSTADFLPPEQRKAVPTEVDTKVPLRVVINVPHNIDVRNDFTFYPYPMMPPKIRAQVKPLPETSKDGLRQQILNSGYVNRTQATTAYPYGGWRWQYAYKAALRRSGLGVPHLVTEMYSWADEMLPYVKPEVVRLNLAEKDRLKRYQRAKEEYDESRADIETESVRKGLFPVEVRLTKFDGKMTRFGNAKVLPGSWFLVGTHRTAGLTYYWNLPVEVDANQPKTVELNEANALLVEGGW